jgi:hydrogenase nickel incorporation protein HypA/HybF
VHESSITESILKIVLEKALEFDAKRVLKIHLAVGEMTGFIGDSIHFYFDRYSKGTIAEGACLYIRYIKPEFKCVNCGNLFQRTDNEIRCPLCNGEGDPTKIGQEFFIENIEIQEK